MFVRLAPISRGTHSWSARARPRPAISRARRYPHVLSYHSLDPQKGSWPPVRHSRIELARLFPPHLSCVFLRSWSVLRIRVQHDRRARCMYCPRCAVVLPLGCKRQRPAEHSRRAASRISLACMPVASRHRMWPQTKESARARSTASSAHCIRRQGLATPQMQLRPRRRAFDDPRKFVSVSALLVVLVSAHAAARRASAHAQLAFS